MTGKSDNEKEEEVVVEETPEGDDLIGKDKIKKLKEKLAVCEQERAEYLDGWQRARAEFINFRREQEVGLKDYGHQIRALTILEILPILGVFELAFKDPSWSRSEPNWRAGIEQIYKELKNRLEGLGVKDFGEAGERFDPGLHDSAGTRGVEKKEEEDIIIEVIEKGWRLEGKVIKPARVIVGKYRQV